MTSLGRVKVLGSVDLDIMSDQLGIIIIGGQRHNLGMIRSINGHACKLFGVARSRALQHNISELMPSPLAEMHDMWMRRFLTSGSSTIIDQTRCVLGLDGEGYLFPMVLCVRQTPPSDGPPAFIGTWWDIDHS